MALTLREALKFGGLFGSTVIAGGEGLDRPVENVSVLEIADSSISKWVEKNQLYVTSFYAIRDNIPQQKIVIETLYNNGCCGLILCNVGICMQNIDAEVIAYCNSVDFPLIQARADVSYMEILTPIINELFVSSEILPPVRSDDADSLLDIIINEEKTEDVLSRFNKKLGRCISYYDIFGQLLYSDAGREEVDWEISYINDNFNQILYLCSKRGFALIEGEKGTKVFALIRSQRNLFGLLVTDLMASENPEETLVHKLVIPCALLLGRRDRMADYRERVEAEFVTDLITGNFASEESAQQRAAELNFNRDSIDRMIIVNVNTFHRTPDKKQQADMRLFIKNTLMPQVNHIVRSSGEKNWCVFRSDIVLVFIDSKESNVSVDVLSEKLRKVFADASLKLSVSLGISRPIAGAKGIPVGYAEAYKAAILGRETYGAEKIILYDQVWFYSQIHEMSKAEETKSATDWMLGPLKEYDSAHGTELVQTLKCLLYNSGNVQKTAAELFIHKNTMLQRKNKIVDLLGYSPFEMPHLLNFLIALGVMDAEHVKWYKDSMMY
ncbi:MAG: PucR family transcriptional regulator [Clostridiales bacterium]|nr:PucR family transcriptional regulator [Clostridiales bacterium]